MSSGPNINIEELVQNFLREINFDTDILAVHIEENELELVINLEHGFRNTVTNTEEESGGMFFLDTLGGTGETF